MTGKRTITILAASVIAAVAAGAASAHIPQQTSLVIHHQLHGCHSWALNGGAFKPTQNLSLEAGSTIVVTNDDVMPHKLVQTSGPAAAFKSVAMNHMGAVARITFAHKGVYVFMTKAGEDYMKGVKTTGEDNVLRLKVTVA